jgi:protein O-GlcNAc transferase
MCLGQVLNEQQRFAEAEAACREAIRLDPGLAVAHSGLGDVMLKFNRCREAEEAFREATRLDPDSAGRSRFAATVAKLGCWVEI